MASEMGATGVGGFTSEAEVALKRLSEAVRAVVAGVTRDGPIRRFTDLANGLRLSRTLAWNVWQLVAAETAVPNPKNIPGRQGFDAFLKAALAAGAGRPQVEEARGAFRAFEGMIREHGGSRSGLEILLSSVASEAHSLEHSIRRELFRGLTHHLGVQARVAWRLQAVVPGPAAHNPLVFASLAGLLGFRRMRPEVRWRIHGFRTREVLQQYPGVRWEPLDPARRVEDRTAPDCLLPAFCSQPMPAVERHVRGGVVEDELPPGPLGLAGAIDLCFGERFVGVPPSEDATDSITTTLGTPCERAVIDLLLHREVHDGRMPILQAYHQAHEPPSFRLGHDRDLIHLRETLVPLGPAGGSSHVSPSGVPRYPELLRALVAGLAFGAAGRPFRERDVELGDFDVFRLELNYPPPVHVRLRYHRAAAFRRG